MAFIKQRHLDEQAERLQRKLLTDWQRLELGRLSLAAKAILERRIQFTWSY